MSKLADRKEPTFARKFVELAYFMMLMFVAGLIAAFGLTYVIVTETAKFVWRWFKE